MIKIEKDVPIPLRPRGKPSKYPWADMEPGDSFFVPGVLPAKISGSVGAARNRHGFRLTMRAENGGTRVWRLPADGESA